MERDAEVVRVAALNLEREDRARLASDLIASLDGDGDIGVEAAWAAEIERRVQEVESGSVKLVPWSEVEAQAAEAIRKVREERRRS
jgi:putative addiction module component (TIGR02574 family)